MTFSEKNELLNKAIWFAVERHAGQVRKGTKLPYIVHPLETMNILVAMDADVKLLVAGVLHDVLEDTETEVTEIVALFGSDVAELVKSHSEDKSKSWDERKQTAIKELKEGSEQLRMLVMADKVSNLRSLLRDYQRLGDAVWSRFNAPKEKQAWYYSEIQDALYELQFYENTKNVYWEMVDMYKDIFVTYKQEPERGCLYQQDVAGKVYVLKKGKPVWELLEGEIPREAVTVPRKYAERIEDNWAELF